MHEFADIMTIIEGGFDRWDVGTCFRKWTGRHIVLLSGTFKAYVGQTVYTITSAEVTQSSLFSVPYLVVCLYMSRERVALRCISVWQDISVIRILQPHIYVGFIVVTSGWSVLVYRIVLVQWNGFLMFLLFSLDSLISSFERKVFIYSCNSDK